MKKRKTHTLEDRSSRIFDVVVIVFLVILSALVIYPLWYVLIASFTDPAVVNTGRFLLYPVRPSLNGYEKILQYPPLWTAYGNTILYTVVGTVVAVAITIPAAYALSRYDLFGRRPLMMLFSFTMFFFGRHHSAVPSDSETGYLRHDLGCGFADCGFRLESDCMPVVFRVQYST